MKYRLAIIVTRHSHLDKIAKAGLGADFCRRGTDRIRSHGQDAFDARIDTFCLELAAEHACRYARQDALLVFYDGLSEQRAIENAGGSP